MNMATLPATDDYLFSTAVIKGCAAYFGGMPAQPPVTHNPGDEHWTYYDRSDELGHGRKDPQAPRHTSTPRPPRPDRGERL
jgi:hypothetical protein